MKRSSPRGMHSAIICSKEIVVMTHLDALISFLLSLHIHIV